MASNQFQYRQHAPIYVATLRYSVSMRAGGCRAMRGDANADADTDAAAAAASLTLSEQNSLTSSISPWIYSGFCGSFKFGIVWELVYYYACACAWPWACVCVCVPCRSGSGAAGRRVRPVISGHRHPVSGHHRRGIPRRSTLAWYEVQVLEVVVVETPESFKGRCAHLEITDVE